MKKLIALVFSVCIFGSAAHAQKVLLVVDDDATGSQQLATALANAGMTVTKSSVPSWQYSGTQPAPAGFDVIVLLAGTGSAANTDMPAAGQTAIANFVGGGGGIVVTEWAAFQVASNRWQTLKPLVLLSRTSGITGSLDYAVAQGFQTHPLWSGLPASFTFPSGTNVGAMIPGPGVARVATSNLAGDGVVARDLVNAGRIVDLSTAGNFAPNTFTDVNLQKLMVNACKWASASRVNNPPVAVSGGPYAVNEGASVVLNGSCTDPNMDMVTMAWDFSHNGAFVAADAQGGKPTFSAANIAGPTTVSIALRCTDSGGLTNTVSTTVTVANVAPTFTSTPPATASEGQQYNYQAVVTDPGFGDMITCSMVSGPSGMTVTGNGCLVSWLPTFDQAKTGKVNACVRATDLAGAHTDQCWMITVSLIDSDGDGLPDSWELLYFGDLSQGPNDDPDMDGRPNLQEYQDGTDPTKYDGPTAPSIVSPDMGLHVPLTPQLIVGNATSPLGAPLNYEYQIYSDKALQNLVHIEVGIPQGMSQTTWTVFVPLGENSHYWWRARAHDPYIAGPWSPVATFFVDAVHEAPTAPKISMPMDGAHVVTEMPTLAVTDATSPDELQLTYTFELYGDANLTMLTEAKTQVAEVKGTTSYLVMAKLTDYQRYWWRARAVDEKGLAGPWSATASFLITPGNPPPDNPKLTAPVDGSTVTTHTPMVVVGGSVDPDAEAVTYQCDADVKDTFDTPQKQSATGLVPDMNNQATWTPNPLSEDTRWCVRCRGRDNSGASDWVQACFLVNAGNNAPSVPTLQNPSDGGMATTGTVTFTWVNAIDPEGDDLRYEVEVAIDPDFKQVIGQGTGADGRLGVAIAGVRGNPDQASPSYDKAFWRARSVDVHGAASDWSKANAFTVGDGPPLTGGNGGGNGACACAVGAKPRAPIGIFALLLALAIWRSRSRRLTP